MQTLRKNIQWDHPRRRRPAQATARVRARARWRQVGTLVRAVVRFVRNIDIDEELDDDYISDGGEEPLSAEDQAAMDGSLARVRAIIGSEENTGLTDAEIRDALWELYFDVDKTVDWALGEQTARHVARERQAAREREKAQKAAAAAAVKKPASPAKGGPKKGGAATPKKGGGIGIGGGTGASTPLKQVAAVGQRELDLDGLNLNEKETEDEVVEEPPKIAMARGKLLEEVRKAIDAQGAQDRQAVSLIVIGHVDAGKSTLMGRLLYELGMVEEKKKIANERASSKMGKGSFSWAWELDGTSEERERGITMDIAVQTLSTPHRQITILDAPGHKDFIPNMISGAAQADCALLVVDATTGEFEAGFERGGQTREHLVLVRSLGVSQVVVAVNKLDTVKWEKDRYEEICSLLRPFLAQSGFHPSKTKFVPVAAMAGINLLQRDEPDAEPLKQWYSGPTLVDLLDALEPPARNITASLRFPIANVFKGASAGTAVSGRVCGGVVQVGERLRILPGDESGLVRSITLEDENVPWAADGANVTLYLTAVDPIHLAIGSVLCPPSDPVTLATVFNARIIVFDITVPLTAGTSVELFHQSHDVPASITKLVATLDRASGAVIKKTPRVLTKGVSAEVEITLRAAGQAGPGSARARPVPLETFAANKEMGRVLVRRGGETVCAGIVLQILS